MNDDCDDSDNGDGGSKGFRTCDNCIHFYNDIANKLKFKLKKKKLFAPRYVFCNNTQPVKWFLKYPVLVCCVFYCF